jgi:hypothetical protein
MTQPPGSAFEQARLAWRRAIEETGQSLTSARDQAEAELRRKWALLRDAVESAMASGVSLEDVARWLGLAPGAIEHLLGRDGASLGFA